MSSNIIGQVGQPVSTSEYASAESTASSVSARPNRRFFLPEEFVTLKVENDLFRVPSFVLRTHSPKFEEVLTSHTSSSLQVESIFLKDTRALDFERLLMILCPRSVLSFEIRTMDEWSSVLRVAHEWNFIDARKLAIRELNHLVGLVDRVLLGHQYGVEGWTLIGYGRLIARKVALAKEEARRLGMEDMLEIVELREHLRKNPSVVLSITDITDSEPNQQPQEEGGEDIGISMNAQGRVVVAMLSSVPGGINSPGCRVRVTIKPGPFTPAISIEKV